MIKKNFKILLSIALISAILFSFTICLADENTNEISSTSLVATDETTTSSETPEIYSNDLYIVDQDVVMDKYVDGNVYIMGNSVKITGAINGDLFVLATDLVIEKGALINGNIFACTKNMNFNGEAFDVYALAAKKFDASIDSYIGRDLRVLSKNIVLKSEIDRNAYVTASDSFDLGSDEDIPLILGDLNYTAKSEITVPENVFPYEESKVNFTPTEEEKEETPTNNVSDVIWGFVIAAFTTLVIVLVVKFFLKTVDEKISKFDTAPSNIFKCFGIGLLILFCMPLVCVLLLISGVGAKLGFILLFILIVIYMVCGPLSIIFITNILKAKLNVEKSIVYYLLIVLVSLILHAISLIPVFGFLLSVFLVSTTFGLFFKNSPKKIDDK